jgi:hypothetical protein
LKAYSLKVPKRYSETEALVFMHEKHLKPLEPFVNVTSKWRYVCEKCGNHGVTTLHAVKNTGSGCPYCSGNKVDPKKIERRLREEDLTPLEPYRSNTAKWKMFHSRCGNEVLTTWADIQGGGGGCGVCRYTKSASKLKRDEASAVAIMREAGGEPLEPYKNNHARWKVRCLKCNQTSHPSLGNVLKGQGVCLACRPKFPVTTKEEALVFVAEKHLKPISDYVSAASKWKLQCEVCQKTSDYIYSQMKSYNHGCVYCSNHKVDPADVQIAFESLGFVMLEEYVNARKPIKAECQSCSRVSPKRYDDIRVGKGCKYCQDSAIDLSAKTYFYLIKHEELNAVKVGIGNLNRKQDRLREHKRHGWAILYRYDFEYGEDAYNIEQQILKWVKKEKNLPNNLSKKDLPQGGWTEAFSADEITIFELKLKFEDLLKDLGK